MAGELRERHKKWIIDTLTPNLIENHKLFNCNNTNNHIKIKSIEIKELSLAVAFMLTNCYFVKISLLTKAEHSQCDDKNDDDEKIFDIVVKIAPDVDPEFYEMLGMHSLFTNEIIAYEYIIPRVKSLSNSPKCYYFHNNPLDAAIALSDFTKDGWRMSKSKVNLSIDHILVAVKELGRFHGDMYALKLTDIDTFNAIKDKLGATRYREGGRVTDEWFLWLELGIRRATNSVRASKEAQSIVPEAFLKRFEEIMYESYEYRWKRIRPIEPFAIICHGDYLRNNVAFRYDADGKAVDAMMFDFQTLLYGSPMIDLVTFTANSTGWEVRDKHFSEIFRAYHESLIENCLIMSKWKREDIPDYLKHDSLLEEYARYLPLGLATASSFLQTLHSDEIPEFRAEDAAVAETIRLIFDKGGEKVDAELRSLLVDIYRLHEKFNLTLEKL